MLILTYKAAEGDLDVFQLGDGPVTIGRSAEADVHCFEDKVSRLHCEIRPVGDGYVIRDLDSKNGTFVNGKRITECPLKPGDRVRVGETAISVSALGRRSTIVLPDREPGRGFSTVLDDIVHDIESETLIERPGDD